MQVPKNIAQSAEFLLGLAQAAQKPLVMAIADGFGSWEEKQ